MKDSTIILLAVIVAATIGVVVALSNGQDGFVIASFLAFLGGVCGYQIKAMREERRRKKGE